MSTTSLLSGLSHRDVKNYFDQNESRAKLKNLKVGGWGAIALGALGVVGEPVVGLVFLAIGIYMVFYMAKKVYDEKLANLLSDSDIEKGYEQFVRSSTEKAYSAVNYAPSDSVRQPDWFWFSSKGVQGAEKRIHQGQDKVWRANMRSFLWVIYGKDQIMTYEVDFCIESDVQSKTNTSEYFYKDVAGVEFDNNDNTLTLRTTGGNKTFPLSSDDSEEAGDVDRAQHVANTIRTMLRERKASQ